MNTRVVGAIAAAVAVLGAVGCGSGGSATDATSSTSSGTSSTGSTIDARDLFVNGKPSTGALACGGCHALAAAGTTATLGPNLDKIATDDDAAALTEMIVDPNAEIVPGYTKDVMPQNYSETLTPAEVQALAVYIDESSEHAEAG